MLPGFPLVPMGGRTEIVDDFPRPKPPPVSEAPRYFTGLDLGQVSDYTALATVERTRIPDPHRAGKKLHHFAVRHLWRWPLGTSYPSIVDDVKELFTGEPLKGSKLVVDSTGVGRGVVDLLRVSGIGAQLLPYTITAGEAATGWTVPKKDLVAAIQAPLQTGRLVIAEDLAFTQALAKELEMFRVKVTLSRSEVFEAWRERDHDDLVLAVALAVYAADRPDYAIPGITT